MISDSEENKEKNVCPQLNALPRDGLGLGIACMFEPSLGPTETHFDQQNPTPEKDDASEKSGVSENDGFTGPIASVCDWTEFPLFEKSPLPSSVDDAGSEFSSCPSTPTAFIGMIGGSENEGEPTIAWHAQIADLPTEAAQSSNPALLPPTFVYDPSTNPRPTQYTPDRQSHLWGEDGIGYAGHRDCGIQYIWGANHHWGTREQTARRGPPG